MNNKLSDKERAHIGRVKELDCSVCNAPGPSDAHHIEQRHQYCVVALCRFCHNELLGDIWRVYKMDEMAALNVTLKRLFE